MAKSRTYDQLPLQDKGFYSGILTCLAILKEADEETYFCEIVRLTDVSELLEVAKHEDEVQFSGLVKYGYADSAGNRLK